MFASGQCLPSWFFLLLFILCFGVFCCLYCTSRATPRTARKPELTRRASMDVIQGIIDEYYEEADPVTIVACEVLIN